MFKYDAFISYRHVHPDMEIAQDIQRLIEAFVVSKAVPAVPKRRDFLVFRDRDELASGELGEAIENALENSAFLIVVCSRRTPLSPWCRREVEYFREVRDPSNIIAVLLEGEPEESFPPELRDVRKLVRTPGGAVQERRDEFLAADVRPDRVRAEGFPGYEEVERDPRALRALRRKSAALLKRTEINRIMATILGVSYGDITQRQRERKMRRAMALVSVVALVLGVFATTVTAMWVKSMRSEEKANERNAAITMSLATKAIADGDRLLGILYSRAAMSAADRSMGSYSRLQGEYYSNLSAATLYEDYTPTLEIKTDSGVPSFGQSASGGELVTAGRDASLTVWNARNGTPVRSIRLPSKPTKVGSARDGSSFYALTENNDLHLVSSGGGRIRTVRTGVAGQVANLVVWKDHAILDVGDGASEKVVGVDLAAGRRLFAMDLNKEGVVSVDVRDDGAEFAVAYAGGGASRHDARTGALSAWIAGRPAGAPSGASGSLARSELIHYAPRGNMLVYLSGSARVYYKADTSTGSVQAAGGLAKLTPTGAVATMQVREDGNAVYALWESSGAVYRFDFASPDKMRTLPAGGKDISRIAITPDGERLVGLAKDNSLFFWQGMDDPRLGAPAFAPLRNPAGGTDPLGASVTQVSFSADRKRAFLLGADARITVVQVAGTEKTASGRGAPQAKSNDGKTLYSISSGTGYVEGPGMPHNDARQKSGIRRWAAVSNDGRRVAGIKKNSSSVIVMEGNAVSYESDVSVSSANESGPLIAFCQGDAVVFAASDGSVVRYGKNGRLNRYGGRGGGDVVSIRVSPDGSLVAVSRRHGGYAVYSAASGKRLAGGKGEALSLGGASGRLSHVLAIDGHDVVRSDSRGKPTRAPIPAALAAQVGTSAVKDASPDGSLLALSDGASNVTVLDARSGTALRTVSSKTTSPTALLLHDGLAYQSTALTDLSNDGHRRVRIRTPGELEKLADAALDGRTLSAEEKAKIGQ